MLLLLSVLVACVDETGREGLGQTSKVDMAPPGPLLINEELAECVMERGVISWRMDFYVPPLELAYAPGGLEGTAMTAAVYIWDGYHGCVAQGHLRANPVVFDDVMTVYWPGNISGAWCTPGDLAFEGGVSISVDSSEVGWVPFAETDEWPQGTECVWSAP